MSILYAAPLLIGLVLSLLAGVVTVSLWRARRSDGSTISDCFIHSDRVLVAMLLLAALVFGIFTIFMLLNLHA